MSGREILTNSRLVVSCKLSVNIISNQTGFSCVTVSNLPESVKVSCTQRRTTKDLKVSSLSESFLNFSKSLSKEAAEIASFLVPNPMAQKFHPSEGGFEIDKPHTASDCAIFARDMLPTTRALHPAATFLGLNIQSVRSISSSTKRTNGFLT